MNYKELTERLGRDDLSMIEEVQQYIVDNYKLKGSARTSAEGIMNSSFGDMQELENAYNKNGAEGGATYIVDNLPDAARKKYLKESASINEGQFSWLTQDSGTQIGSEKGNTIDVWMFDDKGNSWFEDRYEGYGEFGGMDYYELLAVMNGYTEEDVKVLGKRDFREVGIDLAFGKLDPADMSQSDVLFPALVSNKRFNWKRHDFTKEPESDPNQSWMRESYVSDYASFINEKLKK